MPGGLVFVDAARAGRSDVDAVARALSIDAYRARLLLNARAPFLAHGFPSLGFATKAAEALTAAGIPASAHADGDVGRVPGAIGASALTRRASGYAFTTAGGACEVPFESLRALVHAKLTVKLAGEDEPLLDPALVRPGALGRVLATRKTPRPPVHYWRLDLFAEPRPGECVRIAIRHDLFDFSCLLERKTLSAVRNLVALRDEIARARPKGDVPVDEWFDRTEMARSGFAPDAWTDVDLRTGAARTASATSNRVSFELFAAVRFLHERARAPAQADHYFEL